MRLVSTRQARLMRRRRTIRQALVAERGPWCELRTPVCTRGEQGLHELVGRRQGGSKVDARGMVLACNPCNTWCEDNPAAAQATGRKCPSWDAVDGDGGLIPSPEWMAWRESA